MEYLEGWFEVVLEFINRCIARLGPENTQHIICAVSALAVHTS